MTDQSVTVQVASSSTSVTLTPLIPDAALETLRTKLECGTAPDWLTGNNGASVSDYLNERTDVAAVGSSTAMVYFEATALEQLPATMQAAVDAVEQKTVTFEDVRLPDDFSFPPTEQATLRVRGVIDENGDFASAPSVVLRYDTPLPIEHVRTFDDGATAEGSLSLSHNEVVRNANVSMDWVRETDLRRTRQHADEDWLEFLWLTGVEGQVTDGRFEHDAPPFDFTSLLESEGEVGRLLYYAYRYHGWDYSQEQLHDDLQQLTRKYGDGGYLVI